MKKATMNDVAKLAGVSQTTVSFVINNTENQSISESVRKRVNDAVQALGFVPRKKAQNFAKSSDVVIAVIVPNISNLYYPSLIKSIDSYAGKKGYRIITVSTNRNTDDENFYLRLLSSIKVAGIIFGFTPSKRTLDKFRLSDTPIAVIGESDEDTDTVSLNSRKAGILMGRHLTLLGHKKIAFVTSPLNRISLSRKKRLEGLSESVEGKAEIVVFEGANEGEQGGVSYELETGYGLCERVLKNPDITAIAGANDMIAFGALKLLNERNIKVPDEISLCGFDNTFFSEAVFPKLTTIDHLPEERASLAVDIITSRIQNSRKPALHINYDPILVVRGSTGKVRNDEMKE